MTIPDEIIATLNNVALRGSDDDDRLVEKFAEIKRAAVASGNQAVAKDVWCLEQTLEAQRSFVGAFQAMRADAYYDGWCLLEKAELALRFLAPHYDFTKFRLDFVETQVARFQSIFPYKVFFSPEFIQLEKRCSICDAIVRPRTSCGHRVGEVYNGEMCARVVSKAKAVGVAFVEQPVQKYSVPFVIDPETGESRDHYNYAVVKYVVERLRSPFDGWDVEWTTRRHPHDRYRHVGRNEPCPCESGVKYKKCCLREDGVLRPHCDIVFEVPPPAELMRVEYSY